MTTSHDTCFSILLDHEDINGFIDIAHYGIEAMVKHSACRVLIQSFAEVVVKQATEHDIQLIQKQIRKQINKKVAPLRKPHYLKQLKPLERLRQ